MRSSRALVPGAAALLASLAAAPAALADRGGASRDAAASAPAPVQLSLSRSAATVRHGRKVALTAALTSAGVPLADKELALESDGRALARERTDGKGRARFQLSPGKTASYTARFTPVSAADVAAYQPGSSAAVEVAVSPLFRIRLDTALRAGARAVAIPRQRLRVSGTVAPFQEVEVLVRVLKGSREVRRSTRRVVRRSSAGRFAYAFKLSRRGAYSVRASVRGATSGSARARLLVVRSSARGGSRGPGVRALQRRLSALGYLTPVSGSFGASTSRAVLAFRKVNNLGRSSLAGRAVFRRLAAGGGAFRVRYPKAGKHAEFDWSRQVLVLARGARAMRVLHASSGTSATPTVFGSYRFYSKTPGYNSKGMYYSAYFIGGYAIHGYKSVPNYPASHGCIRIPIASAKSVYGWVRYGDRISVYR